MHTFVCLIRMCGLTSATSFNLEAQMETFRSELAHRGRWHRTPRIVFQSRLSAAAMCNNSFVRSWWWQVFGLALDLELREEWEESEERLRSWSRCVIPWLHLHIMILLIKG